MQKLYIFLFLVISYQGYSQDARLLENTWYLHDLVLSGTSHIPPINDEVPYIAADFFQNGDITSSVCNEHGHGQLEYFGTSEFDVLNFLVLLGGCFDPNNQSYASLYHGFWFDLETSGIVSYEIMEDGQNRTLIVTGTNDDHAIYGDEVPILSTNEIAESRFSIYPTMVRTSFRVNSNFNHVINMITIYNSFGQNALTVDGPETVVDISNLPSGIYFVSIQDKERKLSTKKIVKL